MPNPRELLSCLQTSIIEGTMLSPHWSRIGPSHLLKFHTAVCTTPISSSPASDYWSSFDMRVLTHQLFLNNDVLTSL